MKTVLITGSNRGLGRALAAVFASNKYNLILHGRDSVLLEKVRTDVFKYDVACEIVEGDLRSEDTISKLVAIAKEKDIDILINNAGVYMNRRFLDMASSDFREIIDINLIVPILLTHKIFPILQEKRSGLIININSIAGKVGGDGETAYCASKHGLRGFANALQFDAIRSNVRVININLGTMKTDMSKGREGWSRFIHPMDVANKIFELCGEYPSMRVNEIDINRRIY